MMSVLTTRSIEAVGANFYTFITGVCEKRPLFVKSFPYLTRVSEATGILRLEILFPLKL